MRLLFVASRFPFPPFHGDQVRGYYHLRILSRQHQITLVTPEPEGRCAGDLEAIRPFCEQIEVVAVPLWRRLWQLGQVPFTVLPVQTLFFLGPQLRQRVRSLLDARPFDVVHVQLIRMAPVAEGLSGNTPKVIDLIDALSVNMALRAQRKRGPKAWLWAWEARRIQRYERALTQQYDQLVVSSAVDRSAIGDYRNLHVVPNGVDLDAHVFMTERREAATIVFTGTMWYFPNVDAASWVVEPVLLFVRRQLPRA